MTHAPFDDPRSKVANGRDHIQLVEQRLAAFKAAAEPVFKIAKKAGMIDVFLRGENLPPANLALAIGDAIHNIRSALDIMACDVVQVSGHSRSGVYFPMAGFKEGLNKQIKDKNFHKAAPEAITLLRSLRPYKGGNELLRAIHDLDITDKHVFVLRPDNHAKVPLMKIGGATMVDCSFGGTVSFPIGESFHMEGDIAQIICFRRGGPMSGRNVVETLHEMADLADKIIESFAELFR